MGSAECRCLQRCMSLCSSCAAGAADQQQTRAAAYGGPNRHRGRSLQAPSTDAFGISVSLDVSGCSDKQV